MSLQWNAARVAALMDREDIMRRAELARRLPPTLRATVYRSFDANWAGAAHIPLLVHIAMMFDVLIGQLVHEPRELRR